MVDEKLTGFGFDVTNLTDNEMAKAHARYLAGGRAPGVQSASTRHRTMLLKSSCLFVMF